MVITVVNDNNLVGWVAAATRVGEIYMRDVSSMVTNVLARAGSGEIDRLNILDHGNKNGIQIGSDWVTMVSLPKYTATLSRLNGHFSATGFVHLQHCNIGANHPLLCALSLVFGVNVIAGTGKHNPVYRFNTGQYDRCSVGGDVTENVERP